VASADAIQERDLLFQTLGALLVSTPCPHQQKREHGHHGRVNKQGPVHGRRASTVQSWLRCSFRVRSRALTSGESCAYTALANSDGDTGLGIALRSVQVHITRQNKNANTRSAFQTASYAMMYRSNTVKLMTATHEYTKNQNATDSTAGSYTTS